MKQIKIFPILFFIEVLLLLFVLKGRVYAGSCECFWDPGGYEVCIACDPDCDWVSTCGSCFTSDTKIATLSGEKEIQNVKEGDIVSSFDPETGEIKKATVEATHKRQVAGYYILKTESGKEIKVTGEHPVLALKAKKNFSVYARSVADRQFSNSKLIKFFKGVWEKVKGMVP